MNGIGEVGLAERAAVLVGVQGGLRIAERVIDGVLGLRRGNGTQPGHEWAAAIRDQTKAIQEVTELLHRHFEQAARSTVTQDTILHEIRQHDERVRRTQEADHGGG